MNSESGARVAELRTGFVITDHAVKEVLVVPFGDGWQEYDVALRHVQNYAQYNEYSPETEAPYDTIYFDRSVAYNRCIAMIQNEMTALLKRLNQVRKEARNAV